MSVPLPRLKASSQQGYQNLESLKTGRWTVQPTGELGATGTETAAEMSSKGASRHTRPSLTFFFFSSLILFPLLSSSAPFNLGYQTPGRSWGVMWTHHGAALPQWRCRGVNLWRVVWMWCGCSSSTCIRALRLPVQPAEQGRPPRSWASQYTHLGPQGAPVRCASDDDYKSSSGAASAQGGMVTLICAQGAVTASAECTRTSWFGFGTDFVENNGPLCVPELARNNP
jgi:hypothetical protein